MNLLDKLRLIERVDRLIQRKSTGNPSELALRLEICERQVYNLIGMMKQLGAPIYYCSSYQSYCYSEDVNFKYGFIGKTELNKIRGGMDFSLLIEDLEIFN